MKNISAELKRKRGAEYRGRDRSGENDTATVIINNVDETSLEGSGVNLGNGYSSNETNSSLNIFRESFNGNEWNVFHNLSSDPIVSIWTEEGNLGFNIQPFGTSAFGGAPGSGTILSQNPVISKVDKNQFKVTWVESTVGTVVCMGGIPKDDGTVNYGD